MMNRDHITITFEDLGISEDGKTHNKELTAIEAACIDTLNSCGRGRQSAIPAAVLAEAIFATSDSEQDKRNLRELINHLIIRHLLPVMSMPGKGGGYWIPDDPSEEVAVYEARRRRAFTGLMKMAGGRKGAYVDLLDQLSLGFEAPEGARMVEELHVVPDQDPLSVPLKLVTKVLARLENDPQKYAAELSSLQKTFGHLFVSAKAVEDLKKKADELQEMLRKLAA